MNYLEKELNELVKNDSSIFNFLQKGSLDGIWYWDLENPENEWMSPEFWTIFGYDPLEKKHKASEWQDMIHPDDLELALDNFNKHCADENHPYDQLVRYTHKDGSQVWIRCRGIAIRNEHGVPIRMLGAHNDFTNQYKSLSESRLLQSTALNSLDEAIHLIDTEFRIHLINNSLENWFANFGFNPDVVGENLFDAFPFLSNEVIDQYNRVITSRKSLSTDETMEVGFQQITTKTRKIPIESDGEVKWVLTIMQDISAEVETNKALKENEALLQKIADNYPDSYLSIIEKDLTIGFTSGREFFKQGLDPSQFVGLSLRDIFGDQEPFVRSQYEKTFNGEECFFELYINDEYQEYRTVPLLNEDGSITKIFAVAQNVSQRKIAQEKLFQSELKFKMMFNSSRDGIVISKKGEFDYANPALLEMFGYPDDSELQGNSVLKLIAPSEREKISSYISARANNESVPTLYETIGLRKDNSEIHLEIGVFTYVLENELFSLALVRNITERRKADIALQETERQLSTLISNLSGFVYRCKNDRHWTMELISEGVQKITGYSPGSIIFNSELSYADIIHPDDSNYVWETVQDALYEKRPFQISYRIITSNGLIRWVLENGQGVIDANNEIEAIEGYISDITDQKAITEALKISEDRYKKIYNTVPVSIWEEDFSQIYKAIERKKSEGITDFKKFLDDNPAFVHKCAESLIVLDVNDETLKMFNAKNKKDFLGSIDKVITVETLDYFKKELVAIAEGKTHFSGETINKTLDGKSKNVFISIAFPKEKENYKKVLVSLIDISDRVKIENELKESELIQKSVLESSQVCNKIIDLDSKLQYMSSAGLNDLKISDTKSLYGNIYPPEFYSEELRAPFIEGVNKAFSGEIAVVEAPVLDTDGNKIWYYSTFSPALDENGKIKFVIGSSTNITDKVIAEKKLKESEEKHRLISESINAILWEYDILLDQWTYVAPQVEEILGFSPDEFTSLQFWVDQIHEEDRIRAVDYCIQSSKSGEEHEFDYRFIAKDGSTVWLHDSVHVEMQEEIPIKLRGIMIDISLEKKAEEELIESEQRFKALHNASFGGIAIHDKGIILECNQGLAEITGFSHDELIGMNGLLLISDDTRDKVVANINSGFEEPYEAIGVRKNGERYPLRLEAREIPYKGKNVRVVEFRDISESKEAEAQLLLQSAALNAAGNAIVITNRNGDIQWVNPAFTELTGYSFSEVIGKNARVTGSGQHDEDFISSHWETINSSKVWIGETTNKKKTGELFDVAMTISPLTDEAGDIINFIIVSQDISERKRFENALEKRILALTRPLNEKAGVEFEDLFSLKDIQQLQDDFAIASNVASIITKPDGTPITNPSNFCRLCIDVIRKTEIGLNNCYKSDAELGKFNPTGPIIQPCLSGGLWDAGTSITVGGKHIANWLIGQVRDDTQNEDQMLQYAHEIGADVNEFMEAFSEVPKMPVGEFERISKVLFTLSQQLSTIAYQNVQQARFISERQIAEKGMKTYQKQLRFLHEIDKAILAEETTRSISNSIIKQLREFMECQRAVILSYENNFTKYNVLASDFDPKFKDASPDSGSINQYSDTFKKLINNEIFRIKNLSDRDRLGKKISKLGIEETILIPLMAKQHLLGAIALSYQDPGFFTDQDEGLVRQVANQLGLAIQQAQLLENIQASRKRAKKLAKQVVSSQEDERQRVSRELHDESGQMLTALKVQLELFEADLPPQLTEVKSQIQKATELVVDTMDNLRNLAHGLRPPVLDTMGLESTLHDYCLDFSARSTVKINFMSDPVPDLNEVSQITIYRILQESLANITKHSMAKNVDVQLKILPDSIILVVSDDGIGFELHSPDAQGKINRGIGIVGMSERLEIIGGILNIESKPGEGTSLTASIPIDQDFIERREDRI